MPVRAKSARTSGLKRLDSRSFNIDDEIIEEIPSLAAYKTAEATLVVQQTGPDPMEFECRVEVDASVAVAAPLELGQLVWLANYLPEREVYLRRAAAVVLAK